jgi:hypothetical protein
MGVSGMPYLIEHGNLVWPKDIILNKFLIALFISISTGLIGLLILYLPNIDLTIKKYAILLVVVAGSIGYIYFISKK